MRPRIRWTNITEKQHAILPERSSPIHHAGYYPLPFSYSPRICLISSRIKAARSNSKWEAASFISASSLAMRSSRPYPASSSATRKDSSSSSAYNFNRTDFSRNRQYFFRIQFNQFTVFIFTNYREEIQQFLDMFLTSFQISSTS